MLRLFEETQEQLHLTLFRERMQLNQGKRTKGVPLEEVMSRFGITKEDILSRREMATESTK